MTETTQPHQPPAPLSEAPVRSLRLIVTENLLRPILSFRLSYLPVMMVYFAYGALGVIDVTQSFWIKEQLTLTPAQLAGIAVWLGLPWTVKMVFGELVDCVPLFGSQRGSYVLVGASFTASGLIILAGAAGQWFTFGTANQLFVLGAMLIVVGTVIQDVVADAMSTEVVARTDEAGRPRPEHEVRAELGMVQVLGRLSLSFGILAVAGLSGWLADMLSRPTVFLLGLFVPAVSVTGIFIRRKTPAERRAIDWRILGGGIAFGATVLAVGLGDMPYAQEFVFGISMAVVCTMLVLVTRTLPHETRQAILFTSIIIFAFRAVPSVGDGYTWWTIDVLGFDPAFQGVLRQISAIIAVAAMWVFSKQITEYSVTKVLLWITIAGTVLSLPSLGLLFGLHEWTEASFGFGARTIAIIDTAATSPFAQLSMIPLLTLIAFYAPEGQRATWFALMASLMNLALTAGSLETKYLNEIFPVDRGQYAALKLLFLWVMTIGFVLPIAAIAVLGRRIAKT
jgi:BT1 family